MVQSKGAHLRLRDIFTTASPDSAKFQGLTEGQMVAESDYQKAQRRAQRDWFAAIAALEQLLLTHQDSSSQTWQGVMLAGPTPILSHPDLLTGLYSGVFTLNAWTHFIPLPSQKIQESSSYSSFSPQTQEFPLFPQDPLTTEQFCLILTKSFSLLLLLGEDQTGLPFFDFSFDIQAIEQAWSTLRSRLSLVYVPQLGELDRLVQEFTPLEPNYRLVSDFSRQLLKFLPNLPTIEPSPRSINGLEPAEPPHYPAQTAQSVDVELLQALTHEIRTPLTSIRTMTRLLLRKKDLSAEVLKRLQAIDQECTEQINRMELIFRATELETTLKQTEKQSDHLPLVSMSLEQVFQSGIPRWQKQAQRHNVALEVDLPSTLPQVVSNPGMLDQVLTGLIEKFVRSLAQGGAIHLQVSTAGHQLKVQFHTQSSYQINPLKALGELLMFQPETGCLSLNLEVTKNLFQALGGKLTVRQRSRRDPLRGAQQEEVLTIFLPLGVAA